MLALLGAFRPAAVLSRPLFLVFMAVAGVGAVLTAAYFLRMLSRVTHGRPGEPVDAVPELSGVSGPPGPPFEPPTVGAAVAEAKAVEAAGEPARGERTVIETGEPEAAAHGTAGDAGRARPGDATAHELAAWVPLIALTLFLGLWPKALLAVTTPAVQLVLGSGVAP